MGKIIYAKRNEKAINKHVVQDIIYKWLGNHFKLSSVILLAGKYPESCVKRVVENIKGYIMIYLYEQDYNLFSFIKNNSIDNIRENILKNKLQLKLVRGNVLHAPTYARFQDLDFCRTWFKNKDRASENRKGPNDPITIFQNRLLSQKQADNKEYKTIIGTITPRNGFGKKHSVECLNSLCYILGAVITSVDGVRRGDISGYGKGERIKGSGTIHGNGGTYYAYEHKVLITPLMQSMDDAQELEVRLFTYTDTQPMLTFVLLYK